VEFCISSYGTHQHFSKYMSQAVSRCVARNLYKHGIRSNTYRKRRIHLNFFRYKYYIKISRHVCWYCWISLNNKYSETLNLINSCLSFTPVCGSVFITRSNQVKKISWLYWMLTDSLPLAVQASVDHVKITCFLLHTFKSD